MRGGGQSPESQREGFINLVKKLCAAGYIKRIRKQVSQNLLVKVCTINVSNTTSKRIAFTLAEVLITLSIIGIIAAMTLPALIGKYKEKVLVTAAKKGYSTITNAINKWNAENDIVGEYLTFFSAYNSDEERLKALSKQLNIVKFCPENDVEPCGGEYLVKQYKKYNDGQGNTAIFDILNWWRAVLADGSFVSIRSEVENGSCIHKYWAYETDDKGYYIEDPSSPTGYKGKEATSNNCGIIYIDTNGLKGPNQVGQDVFGINFSENGPNKRQDITRGNINYVLANDKLIETENYTVGKYE